jgi:hypothetical protein
MPRYCLLIFFVIITVYSYSQTLLVRGTVSCEGRPQDDVLIDVYEYNSPIKTLNTDSKGLFSLSLVRGKEYIIVFYKSGLMLQSVSMTASKRNLASTYSLSVYLVKDEKSPEGLYFRQPARRIATDSSGRAFIDSRFSIERINPPQRADTVLVLLNRAHANQYILVSNMKLGHNTSDTIYSKQIEQNIRKEMSANREIMKRTTARYDSLSGLEEKHKKATMSTTGAAQMAEVTEAQRLLEERLSETAEHYMLEQQLFLAQARLDELSSLKDELDLASATDSSQIKRLRTAADNARSAVINDRYRAMDANRKFQLYNKYQSLSYQEYIELRLYTKRQDAAAGPAAPQPVSAIPQPIKPALQPVKPPPKRYATITPADTSDNLSKMTDEQRTNLIKQALEEEKRFKNYAEKTAVKKVDGEDMTVKDIHISDDNYELQIDKKGRSKYFKNGKPVTKLTFEFETKRKMVDVLNTIKEVDKFGK